MANAHNKHAQAGQKNGGVSGEMAEKARIPQAGVPSKPEDSEPESVPTKQLPREDEDEDESGSTGDDDHPSSANAALRPADPIPERAIAPEGSVGRRSGTGQAKTHRSFDENEGRQMLGRPVDPEGELPEPHVGDSYQSGMRVRAWRDK